MRTHSTPQRAGTRRIAGDRARPPAERTHPATDPARATADTDRVIELPPDGVPLDPPGEPEILSSADPLEPAVTEPADEAGATAVGPAATPDPAGTTTMVGRRRPQLVVVLLATCLVAVLAACALAAVTTRRDRADVTAGTSALTAGRASAVAILSYDYRHLDADFAKATALTTGSFRKDYQATTTDAVAQLATQTHAVVVARVMAGGVVSSTSRQVTLLLFVNQTTTSNRLDAAKVDRNRVEITMQKVGSRWLVSGLRAR